MNKELSQDFQSFHRKFTAMIKVYEAIDKINIERGVTQRDILPPKLFARCRRSIFRKLHSEIKRIIINNAFLNHLKFPRILISGAADGLKEELTDL